MLWEIASLDERSGDTGVKEEENKISTVYFFFLFINLQLLLELSELI